MKKLTLNRNQLKYIVIIAMLIDHIAWAFIPTASVLGQIMHFIGRLTAPTMAFFAAEGYHYTRDFKKYALRMFLFAVISWIPFLLFEYGGLPLIIRDGHVVGIRYGLSVFHSIFCGLLAMRLWDADCAKWLKIAGIVGILIVSFPGDWKYVMVLWCLFFHIFRDEPKLKWIAYCLVSTLCCAMMMSYGDPLSQLFQLGIFLAPVIIILFYNGESGKKSFFNKWFFYIFYPLHLCVIALIKLMLK